MIEAYAFLAVFTVQILAMSVLHPTRFMRYLRARINPTEPAAQQYVEHRLAQFRALNVGIAVLGLLLLGWLLRYVRLGHWDEGYVGFIVTVYFIVQMVPVCLVAWIVDRINKALALASPKRKAS